MVISLMRILNATKKFMMIEKHLKIKHIPRGVY